MKILLLNALEPGRDTNILKSLSDLLAEHGWEAKTVNLREMHIKPCTSCGNCAAKTPGLCSIKDDMGEIYAAWPQSQLVICLTPVSFGGYHSAFKIAQDRFMPLNTALFTVRKGEIHHKNRYDPTPALMTVGHLNSVGPLNSTSPNSALLEQKDSEKEISAFKYLTERNAINMNIDRWTSVVFTGEEPEEKVLESLLQALKEVL